MDRIQNEEAFVSLVSCCQLGKEYVCRSATSREMEGVRSRCGWHNLQ